MARTFIKKLTMRKTPLAFTHIMKGFCRSGFLMAEKNSWLMRRASLHPLTLVKNFKITTKSGEEKPTVEEGNEGLQTSIQHYLSELSPYSALIPLLPPISLEPLDLPIGL
eukprot:TRINITY_DN191_c0_g2_i7.p1 TRINITY_DN191_c0_g2~~TRINITY_DN191_c0_g2_i7.p1  ORF type:complete len:110 (-),score=10.64 TRINITY_DN191_c0_g2_i7:66-395(-)